MKRLSCILAMVMIFTLFTSNAALAKKSPKEAEIVFTIFKKLMSKGDQAVIGIARVLKAETYLKKLDNPQKALQELKKLDQEVSDCELHFASKVLQMIIMKKSEKDPEKYLENLDAIIAETKERMGH